MFPKDIRKIDLHTHILPSSCPDWNEEFGETGWLKIVTDPETKKTTMRNSDGSLFRAIESNCFCAATRIEECNKDNVTIQVLSTVPGSGFNYEQKPSSTNRVAQFLNDHIAQVVRDGGGRFVGLGTVPMNDVDLALVELRRCVRELGMAGVEIGSHICGKNLDDPEFEPFWVEVEKLDCCVFVHPWDMSKAPRVQAYWFPWLLGMPHETALAMSSMMFGGVFERHPNLRVCFAHGGGCFPGLIGRLAHGFHARPDLCQTVCKKDPYKFLRNVYIDSLVHDSDMLRYVVGKFGSDRVILGSDYPFPLGEMDYPGRLIEETYTPASLPLPTPPGHSASAEAAGRAAATDEESAARMVSDRENMLWRNAARFLKLPFATDEGVQK